MNKAVIVYWISTALLCLIYASGALMYILQRPLVEEGFRYLGYPTYLVTILIVVKIAAALTILTRVSVWLSDLTYAGMLFHLLLAISAHLSVGDSGFVPATLALGLLTLSFLTQNLGRKIPSPNVPSALTPTQLA